MFTSPSHNMVNLFREPGLGVRAISLCCLVGTPFPGSGNRYWLFFPQCPAQESAQLWRQCCDGRVLDLDPITCPLQIPDVPYEEPPFRHSASILALVINCPTASLAPLSLPLQLPPNKLPDSSTKGHFDPFSSKGFSIFQ